MGGKIRGIMALGLAVGAGVMGVWGLSAGCAEAENDVFQRPDCPRPAPGCGDGCVDIGLRETCDDGNRMNGDGCDSSCHRETGADADADADVRADADADAVTETPETTVTLSYRGEAFGRVKQKNCDNLEIARQAGRLAVFLNSNVLEIRDADVALEQQGKILDIRNDAVIVCAGGVLPTAFLKEIGVHVETKHGEA